MLPEQRLMTLDFYVLLHGKWEQRDASSINNVDLSANRENKCND